MMMFIKGIVTLLIVRHDGRVRGFQKRDLHDGWVHRLP